MKYRTRIYYSESHKALMWELWRKGESLQHIAQLLDRSDSSIEGILAQIGGTQPAPRHRSRLALTLAEREEISRSLVAGDSIRSVASTGPRSAKEGIAGAFAPNASDGSFTSSHHDDGRSRLNLRRCIDQCTPRDSGRLCATGELGR